MSRPHAQNFRTKSEHDNDDNDNQDLVKPTAPSRTKTASDAQIKLTSSADPFDIDSSSLSVTTSAAPSQRCKFNPCANGGSCILIDRDRFTCTCRELFHGIYCDDRNTHFFFSITLHYT